METVNGVQRIGGTVVVEADPVETSTGPAISFPPPTMIGNPTAQLMLMMDRLMGRQRADAEKIRDAADKAQDDADRAEIDTLREKASKAFQNALISGGITVGGAALQCMATGLEFSDAPNAAPWAKGFSSGGKAMETSGKAFDSVLQADLEKLDVDQKEHAMASRLAARDSQRETDFEREVKDMQAKALERLESALQEQHQTNLAIIQKA